MNFASKVELRNFILNKRDNLNLLTQRIWNQSIFNKLIESEYYKSSKVIFVFVSFRSEVDTHNIIKKALHDGKVVGVPKVISIKEGMKVYRIFSMEDMETGYYGILEPKSECSEITKDQIDLILMPGAAFDKNGGRIGYGGGFYDRYLAEINKNIKKIALAYDFQVLEQVPMDDNDIRVDDIITN